jgi:hypothetical protein
MSQTMQGAEARDRHMNPPEIRQLRRAAAWFLICCVNVPHSSVWGGGFGFGGVRPSLVGEKRHITDKRRACLTQLQGL